MISRHVLKCHSSPPGGSIIVTSLQRVGAHMRMYQARYSHFDKVYSAMPCHAQCVERGSGGGQRVERNSEMEISTVVSERYLGDESLTLSRPWQRTIMVRDWWQYTYRRPTRVVCCAEWSAEDLMDFPATLSTAHRVLTENYNQHKQSSLYPASTIILFTALLWHYCP